MPGYVYGTTRNKQQRATTAAQKAEQQHQRTPRREQAIKASKERSRAVQRQRLNRAEMARAEALRLYLEHVHPTSAETASTRLTKATEEAREHRAKILSKGVDLMSKPSTMLRSSIHRFNSGGASTTGFNYRI
ncbi:hypothetical protein [Arthrobacter pigmenti]